MSASWRAAWTSRTPRERAVAEGIAALLGLVLYVALVYALDRTRLQMRENVTILRAQAAMLDRQAAQIERLRTLPAPVPRQGELRTLIDSSAREAGLARAQMRVEAKGPDEVQVVLGSAPFAAWLAWVASLELQQVRLETCRIEALAAAGLVSVTATFVRTAR